MTGYSEIGVIDVATHAEREQIFEGDKRFTIIPKDSSIADPNGQ